MSFKQPLLISSTSHQIDSDGTTIQSKKSTNLGLCQVCGDKAYVINYGALSCQSCKTFFRRNGFHPENVRPCFSNRSCKVDLNSRRCCTACRFAKCLSIGMNSDLIRKEIQRNKTHLSTKTSHINQLVVDKQVMYVSQLPTLNLLRKDSSSLNNSEWTLLSNVIYAHDTYSAINQIRRVIEALSSSSLLNVSYDVPYVYQIITLVYSSMESFVSSTPDFRVLTKNEQSSLFERNLHGIIALCSVLLFRTTGMIDNSKCMETFGVVYGSEMIRDAKHIDRQLDFDLTLIKLMLIIHAFSSNCFIIYTNGARHNDSLLNGTFRLFGSQNVYVELLWKYMIYRYGYYDSVLRFSRLMKIFLDLMKYSGVVYTNNEIHHHLVDNVVEQTKQSLIIDQNEDKLLWGKTTQVL